MSFKQYLKESSKIVYHGDNHKTKKLDVSLMNHGNNQEGIGIYFSDSIDTAFGYGRDVVSAEINMAKFLHSREKVSKIGQAKVKKLLHALWKYDKEEMFYWISDYIEVHEEADVQDIHIDEMAGYLMNGEIRNFQIDLADKFGVENMVREWNKIIKIDGLYNKNNDNEVWYAIINPKIKLTGVKAQREGLAPS